MLHQAAPRAQVEKGLQLVNSTIEPLLKPKKVPYEVHILVHSTSTAGIADAIARKAAELAAHCIVMCHHKKNAVAVRVAPLPARAALRCCSRCPYAACAHMVKCVRGAWLRGCRALACSLTGSRCTCLRRTACAVPFSTVACPQPACLTLLRCAGMVPRQRVRGACEQGRVDAAHIRQVMQQPAAGRLHSCASRDDP
jgi:hypothetical protein